MSTLTQSERLALLLNLVGDDAASVIRSGIDGKKRLEVDNALSDFQQHPPTSKEIDFVLDDFEKYFKLAVQAIDADPSGNGSDQEPSILRLPEENFDVEFEPIKVFEKPKLTGNALHDLNLLHPYQVSQALKAESPEIVALVVRKLSDEHAAKTLELLPDSIRARVFLSLAKPSKVKSIVMDQAVAATLRKALEIEERQEEEETSEKMATLMRSLPKSVRTPMLEELEKEDKDLAQSVKSLLYQFDDLEKLSDRDMQKILSQCPSDALAVALQGVDQSLIALVLKNMSKRAKETLQEEMEFKTDAVKEEIKEGQDSILKILVELDDSGEITLL